MEWQIKTESGLGEVVKFVLDELRKQQKAAVLALHGDLGAGKTTFMQNLAKELGVEEVVTSPTFVIMKTYELENQSWEELVHIDAYRIEEEDEMRPLRFDELLDSNEKIVCIEWAENISGLLPQNTLHLNIEIIGEERKLKLENA